MSGRKTEHVGLLTFGTGRWLSAFLADGADRTDNQANRAWRLEHQGEEEDQPYTNIESNVAIQTAKPSVMEQLLNLEVGSVEGNREWPPPPMTELC
jgi:ATP-dependent DNA helicase 2 subunit 2